MQPDFASKCSDCGEALPPPTGALPVDPLLEIRATLQQREAELAAATARIVDAQRQAAAREVELRQSVETLTAENKRFRATADGGEPPPAPAWGSAALAALMRKWPRSSVASAAVLAAGTAFGGLDLGRRFLGENDSPPPVQVSSTGGSEPLIKERDELRDQVAAGVKERDQLTAQLGTAIKERDQLRGQASSALSERDELRTKLAGLENQVATATKDIAAANVARDQALAREKAALGRGGPVDRPVRPGGVSAGAVDFVVQRGNDGSDIVLQRGQFPVLEGSAWPGGECTLMAGNPEAVFDGVRAQDVAGKKRSMFLPGPCNATTIIVKKAPQWDRGDIVRLFWLLK